MNDEDDGDDFNWEDDEQPTANVEVSELKPSGSFHLFTVVNICNF